VVEKVRAAIGAHLLANSGKTASETSLAIYGLTFKPDIDDLRESPAMAIARDLAATHPGPLSVAEPHISVVPDGLGPARLVDFETARAADIHVQLVDHTEFKGHPAPAGEVIDTRGIWTSQRM
jgi:UDP-N-acetyl-D-mannosaminuronic acid dehydrogenase